jgi:hypothetical protein
MHPARYANADAGQMGQAGAQRRFAMAEADFPNALWHMAAGRLLFADRLGLG